MTHRYALAALLGLIPGVSNAATIPVIVAPVANQKSCAAYVVGAGHEAFLATPDGIAASSSWQTWLVRDCEQHFTMLRSSLEAALAATDRFATGGRAGSGYAAQVAISNIELRPSPEGPQPIVTMAVRLLDPAGRVIYGGLLTKAAEPRTDDPGEAYARIEQASALAAARVIAFHLQPLRVIATDGRGITLNYGSPLLDTGTMIQVLEKGRIARFVVVSASGGEAYADPDGDVAPIRSGAVADVIEPEANAANARRLTRGVLP